MSRSKGLEILNTHWGHFYCPLGRGKPSQDPAEFWYTHQGQIIGHFGITAIIRNLGNNIPELSSISGEKSAWQIKLMNWGAVCDAPFHKLEEKVFHGGFRGWRYFVGGIYKKTMESEVGV